MSLHRRVTTITGIAEKRLSRELMPDNGCTTAGEGLALTSMGIAKPMPAEIPVLVKMAVLRPMTLPEESCWVGGTMTAGVEIGRNSTFYPSGIYSCTN